MNNLLRLFYAVYLSNTKRLKLPYKLTFSLTGACNLKCKVCGIWKKNNGKELTADEIEKFFRKTNHFSWIDFTGGEIFLRDDLEQILKTAIHNCRNLYLLHFPTNGFLTERVTDVTRRIAEGRHPQIVITVSLDGEEKLHDELRGVPGSWRRAVSTFTELKKIKGVDVYFGMTLSGYNCGTDIRDVLDSVREIYPECTFNDFHVNIAHSSKFYFNNPDLPENDNRKIVDFVNRTLSLRDNHLKPFRLLEYNYLSRVGTFLDTGKTPVSCAACSASCYIDCRGDIYPCTLYGRRIAGIREIGYDLGSFWKTDRRLADTRAAVKKGDCPGCWTPCEAYQSILASMPDFIVGKAGRE